jgi:hypothetical protein
MRFQCNLYRYTESGALDSWMTSSPSSAVALVVLLDQFARHVYRHDNDRDAKVAANDAVTVTVTERCLELGWDQRITLPQQVGLHSLSGVTDCLHGPYGLSSNVVFEYSPHEGTWGVSTPGCVAVII